MHKLPVILIYFRVKVVPMGEIIVGHISVNTIKSRSDLLGPWIFQQLVWDERIKDKMNNQYELI